MPLLKACTPCAGNFREGAATVNLAGALAAEADTAVLRRQDGNVDPGSRVGDASPDAATQQNAQSPPSRANRAPANEGESAYTTPASPTAAWSTPFSPVTTLPCPFLPSPL